MTVQEKYLKIVDDVIAKGPYKPDWLTFTDYEAPKWFRNAKFGIFIHWGLFSVPAFRNEWYSRNMYIQSMEEWQHHRDTFGEHTKFGYKDFIPMFTAPKFDPKAWAKLFKKAGARYVMPVAEHHDGFQMYDSEISDWTVKKMAMKRDVLGELKEAIQDEDMIFCESNHRVEHAFFFGHGKEFDSDVKDPMKLGDFYYPSMPEPDNQDLYSPAPPQDFLEDWLARNCELVEKYRPSMVYFDWWIQHESVKPYLMKFAAYYYNRGLEWNMEVGISYKHDAMMLGTGILDMERGHFSEAKPFYWQADTSMAFNSWCYTEQNRFKTTKDILQDLVDIVSKNGCLLLNVGPKADGTICEEEVKKQKTLRIVLQPFVENIFEHGFDASHRELSIVIRGYIRNGNWIISIMDNGAGMPEKALEEMKLEIAERIKQAKSPEPLRENENIGIKNTLVRMALYYGDSFRYSVNNLAGGGFIVTLEGKEGEIS